MRSVYERKSDQVNSLDTYRAAGYVPDGRGGYVKPRKSQQASGPSVGVEDESDLHRDILADCKARGWIVLHGSMAHASRRTIGEPDFVILADRGRVFLIEAKSKSGKLKPEQLALKVWAETLGHTPHVVRSMEEYRKAIEA
jgi:hypothetical protein